MTSLYKYGPVHRNTQHYPTTATSTYVDEILGLIQIQVPINASENDDRFQRYSLLF